jgi:hypothetical protein
MKKAVRLFSVAVLLTLVAATSYAPCYYNFLRHEEYWQYHSTCEPNGCAPFEPYSDWWSLDGECDVECDGSRTCWGDTQVRARTDVQSEITGVCEICSD